MAEESKKLVLAIPIFNGITVLDAVGPYECLHVLPNVAVVFVSHQAGPYKATLGYLSLSATHSFDEVPHPDIIIVPGGPGIMLLLDDKPFLDWIRKAHETSMYTTSVCSGSLMLGAAGLLKGLTASTHWNVYDILESYGAKPTADRVVQEGKILTAAGVSSGIDMGLKLVSLITDEKTAKSVQLLIEYDPQPPFDTGCLKKAAAEPDVIEKAKSIGYRLRAHAIDNHGNHVGDMVFG
ncbi:hypothetical protein Mapa_011975 [Marchantia paleacea]|nr:hypothetical protein Mapa_011975 [Marchantia paleacea]